MDDEDPCSLEDLPQRLPMLFFFILLSLYVDYWCGFQKEWKNESFLRRWGSGGS